MTAFLEHIIIEAVYGQESFRTQLCTIKRSHFFISIIRDSLIYIVTLSHCVQVEGGGDPDDLEELEDAQSLAKVKVIMPLH